MCKLAQTHTHTQIFIKSIFNVKTEMEDVSEIIFLQSHKIELTKFVNLPL